MPLTHNHVHGWVFKQQKREGEGGISTVQCQHYFLDTWDQSGSSGLLAPRANTKASVYWADKYSVLILSQHGLKSSWTHGTLTFPLCHPPYPSFAWVRFTGGAGMANNLRPLPIP